MTNDRQRAGKALNEIARKIKMMAFDFDGVFTDNRVMVLQDGSEAVLCNRSDGIGLAAVRRRGITTLVISTEVNPVVSARCTKLDLTCFQGCDDKVGVLKEQAAKLGVTLDEVAFMGNDVNDAECLKIVGLPVCVADSHSDVAGYALYTTKLPGGAGAVRELCDFVVKAKDAKLSQ
jgi:YrbI family 3-deoxy-D-manno-octulosonate 8-phosphate phosphatase